MPTLSSAQARAQIVALLDDTVTIAGGLQDELVAERRALEQQDMDAIDAVIAGKSSRIDELVRMDKARENLCTSCGFASGPERMNELMNWCDSDDMIKTRWNRLMDIAAESSAINITNGAIIRARQQQFDASLAVLRGTTPGSETYNPDGGESSKFASRSIAQA